MPGREVLTDHIHNLAGNHRIKLGGMPFRKRLVWSSLLTRTNVMAAVAHELNRLVRPQRLSTHDAKSRNGRTGGLPMTPVTSLLARLGPVERRQS